MTKALAQSRQGGEGRMSSQFFPVQTVYPKLTVNAVGDRYEQEADATADQVMRMEEGPEELLNRMPIAAGIQRKCTKCEDEVQREAEDNGNYGDTGAWIGALVGGLAGIAGGIAGGMEIFERTGSYAGGILGGIGIGALATGLGALIGWGFGSLIDRPPLEPAANCSDEQVTKLESAKASATQMLNNALAELDRSSTSQHVRRALWLMFRSDSTETANTVKQRLQRIQSGFSGIHYKCSTEATEDTCAYAGAFVSNHSEPVHLCPPPFADDVSEGYFPQLLIHEAAHLFYPGVDDHGYYTGRCHDSLEADVDTTSGNPNPVRERATEGDPPAERLANADSYSCLVELLADERLRSEDTEEREAGIDAIDERYETRRGDRMQLIRSDHILGHSDVNLDADFIIAPQEFGYEVINLPPGANLSYQWQMFTGPDTNGEPIDLQDNDERVNFMDQVPAIKQRGASRGTLRCIVTIPGVRGEDPSIRNVDLPLNFRLNNRDHEGI